MPVLEKVEFEPVKTLFIIENNGDLNKVFKKYIPNTSYNVIRTMITTKTLTTEIMGRIREVFDGIISQNSKILDQYAKLTIKHKSPYPKYYGKQKVLEDLKNNPKSEIDSALLALNDLRNVLSRLRRRCIRDKTTKTDVLTYMEYREIVSSVKILKSRVKPILNNKL